MIRHCLEKLTLAGAVVEPAAGLPAKAEGATKSSAWPDATAPGSAAVLVALDSVGMDKVWEWSRVEGVAKTLLAGRPGAL